MVKIIKPQPKYEMNTRQLYQKLIDDYNKENNYYLQEYIKNLFKYIYNTEISNFTDKTRNYQNRIITRKTIEELLIKNLIK